MQIVRIGLDLAKNVFEVQGVDAHDKAILRKTLRRDAVPQFFAELPPCVVGMEACSGSHYWAKAFADLGHEVRLISPQFVAPYVTKPTASLASAYEAKEPWFGYYWAPTALLSKYPMVAVDIGSYDPDAMACVKSDDCADPQKTAYEPAEVVTGVTTDFIEREPEVAMPMSNVTFTNAQMGSVLAWQEGNQASADEAAVYFLTTYKDQWGDWINEAAREKLSALLQ